MMRTQNIKAFSIIEIMIVIVIIAVLASLGVWSYGSYQQRARNTSRATAAKSYMDILGVVYAKDTTTLFQKNTGVTDIRFCLGTWFTDINSDSLGDCYALNVSDANFTSVDNARNATMQTVAAKLPDSPKEAIVGDDGVSRIGPIGVIKATGSGGMLWVYYVLEKPSATTCPFGSIVWQDSKTLICEDQVNVST